MYELVLFNTKQYKFISESLMFHIIGIFMYLLDFMIV